MMMMMTLFPIQCSHLLNISINLQKLFYPLPSNQNRKKYWVRKGGEKNKKFKK